MRPPLIGTLKSTRTNARLPLRSRSLIESFGTTPTLQAPLDEHAQQVHASVRVAPLVVVPREDLHEVAVHDLCIRGVDNRGIGIALEIDRDKLVGRIGQ